MKSCSVLASLALVLVGATAIVFAQEDAGKFNGLYLDLGNLPRLSHAKSRSISPENFTGEKGKGGMATEGTGAHAARDLGPGLEDLALGADQCAGDVHAGRDRRAGRHSADLDDADRQLAVLHPALLLGRRDRAVDRGAGRRLLRQRMGEVRAGQLDPVTRQSRQRVQLLLGDAVPQVGEDHAQNIEDFDPDNLDQGRHEALLPGQLHAHRRPRRTPGYFHAQFRRTNPVPFKTRLHHRRRHQGPGPLRRHLHGVGSRTATVGGARARSSSSWTATRSSPPSSAPAPRTTSSARMGSAIPRPAPTSRTRRRTPACRR